MPGMNRMHCTRVCVCVRLSVCVHTYVFMLGSACLPSEDSCFSNGYEYDYFKNQVTQNNRQQTLLSSIYCQHITLKNLSFYHIWQSFSTFSSFKITKYQVEHFSPIAKSGYDDPTVSSVTKADTVFGGLLKNIWFLCWI